MFSSYIILLCFLCQLQVTSLAWNSTGAVVAGAFGRFDHEDWCTHKSFLCTWNLDRRGMTENKPDMSIDLQSCLMCIAFHPKNPAWIVGGTFDGKSLALSSPNVYFALTPNGELLEKSQLL